MKTSPLFLILVFVAFELIAQSPPSIFNSRTNLVMPRHQTDITSPNKENHASLFSGMDDVLDSLYYWTWDINNWLINAGEFYVFDDNGNILSQTERTYENGFWRDMDLTIYSYDINDNLINSLYQEWDGLNWVNYSQFVFTYDVNGNQTNILSQTWNGSGWNNEYKQESTYDGNNNQITLQTSLWIGGVWTSGTRHSFSYDAQNRLTVHLVEVLILDWTNSQQNLYTYDANGDLEMILIQNWNGTGWDDSGLNLFDYDANHNLVNYVSQSFEGNVWVNGYQYTYSYDSSNNVTSLLSQYYLNGNWVNDYRFIDTYDAKQNRITEVFQLWEDMWVNQDSLHYYYSLSSSTSHSMQELNISVFPNPAGSFLQVQHNDGYFEENRVSIYSSTGMKMGNAGFRTDDGIGIDISQYSPGSYYVRVHSEKGSAIRKFIKL